MSREGSHRASLATLGVALLVLASAGCSPRLDVGLDVLWVALFEGNDLDEWTGVEGGGIGASPVPPSTIEVSADHPHHGLFDAKLTIDAGGDGVQQNTGLVRRGSLPEAAYYSAWYYLPRSAAVGDFWVLFKFRQRAIADDPASDSELFDLGLVHMPSGEMTLELVDHRVGPLALDVPPPVVPVGVWFQIEAFYRNAADASGHLTFWLDGLRLVDVSGPMSPTTWVEWDVVNVGKNLNPSMQTVFIDDCAVSNTRVGPAGIIAR